MKHAWVLQHVAFEGPGAIGHWLDANGYQTHSCHLYRDDPLPPTSAPDLVVVMGGPMNIHEEQDYPFLQQEKAFLAAMLARQIPIVGVCLGAQLLADVLGARVSRHPEKEIGWFPVHAVSNHPMASLFADSPAVLHWHGDTFALPDGAIHLLASEACANQAFLYQGHVLGLQFHLEMTAGGVKALCDASADELMPSPWVQDPSTLCSPRAYTELHQRLFQLLDHLCGVNR